MRKSIILKHSIFKVTLFIDTAFYPKSYYFKKAKKYKVTRFIVIFAE